MFNYFKSIQVLSNSIFFCCQAAISSIPMISQENQPLEAFEVVETPRLAQWVCEVPTSAQSMPICRVSNGVHGFAQEDWEDDVDWRKIVVPR